MKKYLFILFLAIYATSCSSSQESLTIVTQAKTRAANDLTSWMQNISGQTLVAKLSIPGTHDTGAYVTGGPMIITQDLNIEQQLNAGIRAMDMRLVAMNNDHLEIYHGISAQHLNFEYDVLHKTIDFLQQHPSETVIMSLRKEQDDINSPRGYAAILREILEKTEFQPYIATQFTDSIKLNDVRGKILFLSRNYFGEPYIGGVFSGWPDNTIFTKQIIAKSASANIHVEDYYQVGTLFPSDINKKLNHIYQNLAQASQNATANADWYITFTSGTGWGAFPNAVADRVNEPVANYILQNQLNSCGIILMDFAGWNDSKALINTIINCNTLN